MTQFYTGIQRLKSFSSRIVTLSLLAGSATLQAADSDTTHRPLNWFERGELSQTEQQALPSFCSGNYRIPAIVPLAGDLIEVEADQTELQANGDSVFTGNVIMQQQDRILRSQRADWSQRRNVGDFQGEVSLTTPELVLEGQAANADNSAGILNFYQSQYALPARHLRGSASRIETLQSGYMNLSEATFTFCEPGSNDWDIAASELHLDQNAGIGSAWHTRLRIAEVPVLYIPYYRFPIGDQRMTGFLDPSLSINSQLQGEDIQLPFYWNIAPNADATFTPHYVGDRGTVLETQFRHKTALLGDGELNYAVLDHDKTDQTRRWLVNYQQEGRWGQNWQHRWEYNNVSDEDYLNDMTPTAAIDRTTHLPRRGEILWERNDWHVDLTAESFQTIDRTIALANRPYGRLPQLTLSYRPLQINQWQLQQTLQATRFSRKDEDWINGSQQTLSGFSALNGDRLLSDTSLSYPLEWPFGFVRPELEYRHRSYTLRNADDALLASANAPDLNASYGAARYSLDAGLYFDRAFEWFGSEYLQTLEPRLFWVKSPYVSDQEDVPNFDSTLLTVTYASLFSGERFTGGDRLADLDQISTGLTTRFIREDGLEQFRASAGQIFYQADRRVQLNGATVPLNDTRNTSSLLTEVEWNPNERWSVYSTLEWDPYEDYARQNRLGIRYEHNNRMLNLASNTVQTWNSSTNRVQTSTDQIDAGAFWTLNDRWALVARMLYDNRSYLSTEKTPSSRVLESLAGLEYQNCCWRLQFTYRESSQQETDSTLEYSTRKRYGFLFSIQLKGLGNFGAGTDKLISESIPGYSRRQYHDY